MILLLIHVLVSLLLNIPTCMVYSQSFVQEDNMGKIIFSSVVFRHGDRTPIDPYPNDPYKNASYWPIGFGQLTNTGKEQEYELGKWLRRRYDSLLSNKYSNEIIYIQSTDVDRTLMSAASNLAAIYPPEGSQVWNPDLKWQPIPIHTTMEKFDKVLGKYPCPAYEREFIQVQESAEIQDLIKKYSDVFRILNENTGKQIKTLDDVEYVYNTLFIEELYNYVLPTWTKSVYPEPMSEVAKYSFALPTWTTKMARLKSGLLIGEIISYMVNKKENNKKQPNYNIRLYSAHDTTVANLLNSLGVFDLHCPPYSAAVALELRQDTDGNYNVAVFYHNSSAEEPFLLTVPGCSALCPFEKFVSLCEPLIPQDWDKECQASSLLDIYPSFGVSVIALAVASLLILLVIVSVAFYRERRKRHTHCNIYRQLSLVPSGSTKVDNKPV